MHATVMNEPARNQLLRPPQWFCVASVAQPTPTSRTPSNTRTSSRIADIVPSEMAKCSEYSAGRMLNAGPRSSHIGSVGSANSARSGQDSRLDGEEGFMESLGCLFG